MDGVATFCAAVARTDVDHAGGTDHTITCPHGDRARMVPLFGGVPGGPELLIILLVLLLLFGGTAVLVLLLGVGGLRLLGGANDDAGQVDERRVEELERELAETREELAELRDERDPGSDADAGASRSPADGDDDYDESRSA